MGGLCSLSFFFCPYPANSELGLLFLYHSVSVHALSVVSSVYFVVYTVLSVDVLSIASLVYFVLYYLVSVHALSVHVVSWVYFVLYTLLSVDVLSIVSLVCFVLAVYSTNAYRPDGAKRKLTSFFRYLEKTNILLQTLVSRQHLGHRVEGDSRQTS